MKTLTTIIKACKLLKREDLLLLVRTNEIVEISDQQARDLENLMFCLNEALCGIAFEYVPILKTVCLQCNKEIEICEDVFGKWPHAIVWVKEESTGNKIAFNIEENKIKTDFVGNVRIRAKFFPDEVENFSGEIKGFPPFVTEREVALSTAANFATIEGLFSEASIWESKFRSAMEIATTHAPSVSCPPRRWT